MDSYFGCFASEITTGEFESPKNTYSVCTYKLYRMWNREMAQNVGRQDQNGLYT